MWGLIAAGAASGIAGGLISGNQAKKGAKQLAQEMAKNRELWDQLKLPSIEEQQIILQNPDLMGEYTPEQIQAMELNVSAMEGIRPDEQAVSEQRKALESISEVAEGGLTEADKAAARQVNREVSQQAQARQKAILNAMASRGTLGSGMELAAQLQGEQQSIDQASRAGDALTQQAQARALQAIGQQGSLAGQMRQQQYGEQSDLARARDAINQFNLQNRQRVSEANIGNRNQAQMTNLQARQALENQRAQLANQQQMYNKGLIQQDYQNRVGKLQGVTGANTQAAQANANIDMLRAQQTAGMFGSLTNMFGGLAANQQQNDYLSKLNQVKAQNDVTPQKTYTLNAYNYDPSKVTG
jgi:hypothetical protein